MRPPASQTALIDMVGFRVGTLTVVGRSDKPRARVHWVCRCDCGALVDREGSRLREARERGWRSACDSCLPRNRKGPRKQCAICGATDHTRRGCPQREGDVGRHCPRCCSLAHRRDRPRCRGCGEPHRPLPAFTVDDVLVMPVEPRGPVL